MDECVGHGSILNAHLRTSRPLTYFTTGQRVPEDIEPATAERLVRLILSNGTPDDRFRSSKDTPGSAAVSEQSTRRKRAAGKAPRVIAVTSGKGGVGKSNVVANLAVEMSRRGRKVLVLDADLGLANVDILLGLAPVGHLGDVVSGNPRY